MTNIISWNVNGLRAVTPKLEGKSLASLFKKYNADIFCFQETKISSLEWIEDNLVHVPGYESFWSFSKKKKGYSGVATFARKGITLDAKNIFGEKQFDEEGRIIMTDHGQYILFNVYFPNGGTTDDRRKYKHDFYDWFRDKCKELMAQGKQIIVVGDVNTAHTELDTHRPDDSVNGYLPKERAWLTSFLECGFVDTFRHVHGERRAYSWWDPKSTARLDNKGWRIDFGFVTCPLAEQLVKAEYLPLQFGSDHCPFSMSLSTQITLDPHPTPELSSDKFRKKQAKISSFFVRKPPPEELIEEGSDDETGISVSQSQSQAVEEKNSDIDVHSNDNKENSESLKKEPIQLELDKKPNEKPALLSVPSKAKPSHRPPTKKNPAGQLEKEREELVAQGIIIDNNNKSDINTDHIDTSDSNNNNNESSNVSEKKIDPPPAGPKKNINFLAELNNKLSKPNMNLKRKASDANIDSTNHDNDNNNDSSHSNKRRKIDPQ